MKKSALSLKKLVFATLSVILLISIPGCDKDDPHVNIPTAPKLVGQWYNTSPDFDNCKVLDIQYRDSVITYIDMSDAELGNFAQGHYFPRKNTIRYKLDNGICFEGTFTANDTTLLLSQDSENITAFKRIQNGFSIKSLMWHYSITYANIKAAKSDDIVLPDGISYKNSDILKIDDINEKMFNDKLKGQISQLRFITDLMVEQYYIQGKETKTSRREYEFQNNVLKMSFVPQENEEDTEALVIPASKGKNRKEAINIIFTKGSTAQLLIDFLVQDSKDTVKKVSEEALMKLKSDILATFDKLNVTVRMEAE